MRIGSVLKHSSQAILEGALIATLVVGVMAGTAFAGKPSGHGGGGTTTGSGTCWVNPDPVAVAADYTLTGSGLGANGLVNVLIHDSMGTTSWNLQADASGVAAITWHSYAAGKSNVTFSKVSSKHGSSLVASCSFSVN